ncbi:hypothetical protein DFJ63DRAFT_200113 [Scheffersomyces coipomensis]|uniref:uncharacterized protein n=1 Tax=Scheffersomyces coipomensis TaxID=1788519 RepID=UPI00315C5E57
MSEENKITTGEDVENTSDNELSKEERLELARKKFEELKKKKKGKKSKKTKKDEEATNEDGDDAESREQTPAVEDTPDVEGDAKEDDTVEESKPEEVKEEQPKETPAEVVEQPKQIISEPVSTSTSTSDEEVKALKDTIEQQKNTIKKLRDENTDLKLLKMDLNDKISELQKEVKLLQGSGGSTGTSSTNYIPNPVLSPAKPIVPAKPVYTQNDYATLSQQNFAKFNHTEDFREKLMVWKSWQVDMTNWSQTQKVAL